MRDGSWHGWLSFSAMHKGQSMAICGVTCSNKHVTLFNTVYNDKKHSQRVERAVFNTVFEEKWQPLKTLAKQTANNNACLSMKIAAIHCPSATHSLCPFDHQLAIQRLSSQWAGDRVNKCWECGQCPTTSVWQQKTVRKFCWQQLSGRLKIVTEQQRFHISQCLNLAPWALSNGGKL